MFFPVLLLFKPFYALSMIKAQQKIRIATRASQLAVAQATMVQQKIKAIVGGGVDVSLVRLTTTGDKIQVKNLSDIGGKGLFTKEVEEALLVGKADIAVHSMKDMPMIAPDGLEIAALLEREDPRDALILREGSSFADLKQGAVIGTSSVRRKSQLLALRPDLKIVQYRGNVNTRLAKLTDVDATILAVAGLNRLGFEDKISEKIDIKTMLPSPAQGTIGIQCREGDIEIKELLSQLNHLTTEKCIAAERAFLIALEGSCKTPIAALATLENDEITLRAALFSDDGTKCFSTTKTGNISDAEKIGTDAGLEIRRQEKEHV